MIKLMLQVARVYIGSFWSQPLHYDVNRGLFELEEQDLFADIQSLPRNAILRKLNDLIKRARLAKVLLSAVLMISMLRTAALCRGAAVRTLDLGRRFHLRPLTLMKTIVALITQIVQ